MTRRFARGSVPFVFAASLALATAAQAQPPLADMSFEELGRLEVTTVAKQPTELWRSAAAVSVLTQDDIRRSGATSLAELLRSIAGVQVSRLDTSHWAIGVRGLVSSFSKSLLVLIDGRSVYTPLFGGVFWDVQDTLLADVDRIEVIRGPGGTIWGANAVDGVINVITKSSSDTQGLFATVTAGNVDESRVGVRYGGRLSHGFNYRVYAKGFTQEPQFHTDGRNFDDRAMVQSGFRIDRGSDTASAFSLQGDIYKGHDGDSVNVGSFFPPKQLLVSGDEQVSGGNVLARWQRSVSGNGDVRFQAYYDHTNRDAIHYLESRHSIDLDLLHHRTLGRVHHLSVGAGARFNPSNFTPRFDALTFDPEDHMHRLVSAFAQDEIALAGEAVWLTLGSKFEHNSYSGLEIQPTARVVWRPRANESVWGAVTRAVRTPSRIDTELRLTAFGLASPLAYLRIEGTPDFQAERLVGVEAGYRRLLGGTLFVDVTAFHNDHHDLAGYGIGAFTAETTPVPHLLLRVPYTNVIEGTGDGFEIAPDWRPASWARVKGGYALLTMNMRSQPGFDDPANIALYEGSSPRHQGFVQASLTLPQQFEIDHTYRFASRLAVRDIPGYVTADLRVARSVGRGVTVSVVGQNLLQARHAEFFRDDPGQVEIRRAFYAALTWRR